MGDKARIYEYVSYEEFEKIQNENPNKLEYDNGYIYLMTPVHPNHDRVKNKIASELIKFLGFESCDVFTSDVAVVFESNEEKYEFQPDVMVCCDDKFQGSKYKGIPKLTIEILSYATEYRDKGLKLKIYEKFNVPEYWIVDIREEQIIVYSTNTNGKYLSSNIYTKNMIVKSSLGININVNDIFSVIK